MNATTTTTTYTAPDGNKIEYTYDGWYYLDTGNVWRAYCNSIQHTDLRLMMFRLTPIKFTR